MKIGIDFARFTWDGGDGALGATAAECIRIADEAGFDTIPWRWITSSRSRWWGSTPSRCSTGTRSSGSLRVDRSGRSCSSWSPASPIAIPGCSRVLRHHPRRAVRWQSHPRHRRGVGNEQEHLGLGVPFPSTSELFPTTRRDAVHLRSDVVRRQRGLRGPALPNLPRHSTRPRTSPPRTPRS